METGRNLAARSQAIQRYSRISEPTMPAAPNPDGSQEPDLYAALGVSSVASSTEIRRAYRTLITKVRLGDPRCNSLT